jgi:rod shape-determining protein MreD
MVFVIYCSAILQSVVPAIGPLGHAKIPFLLMSVLYYALSRERGEMLVAAILAGLFQDALSLIPLGYSSLCFCVVGLGARQFKDVVFTESLVTAGVFGAAAAASQTIMCGFLLRSVDVIADPAWVIGWRTVGTAVLGMVFTPIVFLAAVSLERMVGNVSPKRDPSGEKTQYV